MIRFALCALWLLACASPALAAPPAAAGMSVPPPRIGLCAACHGRDGIAVVPGAPNLAGQRVGYLVKALKAYRDGDRKAPVMQAAVGPLSAADLKRIAQWYAAQRRDGGRKQ